MQSIRNTWRNKPIVILLAAILVFLILLLVGLLIYRALSSTGQTVIPPNTTTVAGATPTQSGSDVLGGGDPDAQPTPTNTPVLSGGGQVTPTPTNTTVGGASGSATPTTSGSSGGTGSSGGGDTMMSATATPTAIVVDGVVFANVIANGNFEAGFQENGVAKNWESFTNGSAAYIFTQEQWPPAIYEGDNAQRITIIDGTQMDRYAGIYQTVPVIPGQYYTLAMSGQIRSGFGDVQGSQYGYRMQYAIDRKGGTDWQDIHTEDWVELPWDEQLIDGENVKFLSFTEQVWAKRDKMTVFIRAWNKWPDKLEGQYTLDQVRLVGPRPAQTLVDQPLPETGAVAAKTTVFWQDTRFWVSLFLLVFLIGSATWQVRRRRYRGQRVED